MDGGAADECAILASRFNVDLAGVRKRMQSQFPLEPEASLKQLEHKRDDDDDDDDSDDADDDGADHQFTLNEAGGVDSQSAEDDEGFLDGLLRRRPQSTNEKLLERLMGKKAAQAYRKNHQQPGKSVPVQTQPRVQSQTRPLPVESDDEDEGRAAAFSSRKTQKRANQTKIPARHSMTVSLGSSPRKGNISTDNDEKELSASPPPTKKRVGNSYLDEMLARKAKTKSKKK